MDPNTIHAATSQFPGFITALVLALIIWLYVDRKKILAELATLKASAGKDVKAVEAVIKKDVVSPVEAELKKLLADYIAAKAAETASQAATTTATTPTTPA